MDEILAALRSIEERLTKIETGQPEQSPSVNSLDFWVEPIPNKPAYGLGVQMATADVYEAKKRALYGVNWRGDIMRADKAQGEVWDEIRALKNAKDGDPIIDPYRMLDQDFCFYALLVGIFDISKYDYASFGARSARRAAWAGETIQSFLDKQIAITGGPSGS